MHRYHVIIILFSRKDIFGNYKAIPGITYDSLKGFCCFLSVLSLNFSVW